jgi:SAM-dependent methyltransferase
MSDDPKSPEFQVRRAEARKALDAIDPHMKEGGEAADPRRKAWFDAVYENAAGDAAGVPWASLAPHRLTAEWIGAQRDALAGLAVLDVGCGLGDNAEAFATAGACVAGFDLAEKAIDWAKRRFPESRVDYRAADLFDLPADWRGAFDLVHECYTLQALPAALHAPAFAALAACLKPKGELLVVARARDEAETVQGPPWPLPPSAFDIARAVGLRLISLEDIPARDGMVRHWRAVLTH